MTLCAGTQNALIIAACLAASTLPAKAQTSPLAANANRPMNAGTSATNSMPANAGIPENSGSQSNGAAAQPQQLPLAPPFVLSSTEESNLNQLLTDWESANTKIKTFKCTFTRWEYDPTIAGGNPNQPTAISSGELKYAPPDKGMFKVEELTNFVPDPKTGKLVKQNAKPTEWWTCDGKSMFEVTVRDKQTLVVEKPLPPEMQGKAITEGPLPFVFGARADSLKKRYYMRLITPPSEAKTQVWLEAFPKMQKDAANFSRVTIILNKADLQPAAVQIFNPGANAQNLSRTVLQLDNPSINNPWAPLQNLFDDFARPNPFGSKHVMESDLMPPPAATQMPAGNPADLNQASRPKSAAR